MGLVAEGNLAEGVLAPEMPLLQDRDQALVHGGGEKKIIIQRVLYALHGSLSSPMSPPQKVAPLLWSLATNSATLCFPTLHIQLVMLLSLLAPELCSDACAGLGLLTGPWMAAWRLSWRPIVSPHSPDASLAATSLLSTSTSFWP